MPITPIQPRFGALTQSLARQQDWENKLNALVQETLAPLEIEKLEFSAEEDGYRPENEANIKKAISKPLSEYFSAMERFLTGLKALGVRSTTTSLFNQHELMSSERYKRFANSFSRFLFALEKKLNASPRSAEQQFFDQIESSPEDFAPLANFSDLKAEFWMRDRKLPSFVDPPSPLHKQLAGFIRQKFNLPERGF